MPVKKYWFGNQVQVQDCGFCYETRNWFDLKQLETLTFKEEENLTIAVEQMGETVRLCGSDLFVFLDNKVFE